MAIEILGADGNDVVVIGEFAGFGGEANVGDARDFVIGDFKALGPLVFGFVHEVEFEGFVLEVG